MDTNERESKGFHSYAAHRFVERHKVERIDLRNAAGGVGAEVDMDGHSTEVPGGILLP